MRYAITIGFPHDGKPPRVLCGPEIEVREQVRSLKKLYASGESKDFERVEVARLEVVKRLRLRASRQQAKPKAETQAHQQPTKKEKS